MRPIEDLRFILARVLQDIEERPSIRPYLGEPDPNAQREVCQRGHPTGPGRCRECAAAWKRQKRAEGSVTW